MRIITGDECGLLKEVIPELCRPSTTSNNIHAGKARPSATSIQAAASSYGTTTNGNNQQQNGIQRLETDSNIQSRERGIISLSFLPPPPTSTTNNNTNEQSSEFNFAALRTNGIVETWNGTRINNNNDDEVNVTSARYKKYDVLVKGILPVEQQSSSNSQEEEKDVSDSDNEETNQEKKTSTKGWYTNQPIRPIGMVSNYSPASSSFTTNPILATCDSIGTISLINPNKLSDGVISTYNAFDIDTSSTSSGGGSELPTPSSSKNNSNSIGTLTYTRGRYANVSIATSIAIDNNSSSGECKLAVGGRERGVRLLDLETGKLLWKAKNLPPDPQTLLQQPMWTTSIQFLHTPTSAISTDSPSNLLATGSAYKQVQIYDIRVSSGGSGGGAATSTRRPVLYTPDELLSHRITSICQLNNNGNTIAVGDTIGDVHLLDMRKMHSGKPSHRSRYNNNTSSSSSKHKAKEEIGLGRLVGPGGSIKQLYVHPTLPILSCVGLDRKLWTYDVNRNRMIDCIYLKQRLNCMLLCDDESWNVGNEEDENEEEENGSMNVDDDLEIEDEVQDYVNSDDDDDEEGVKDVDNGQFAKKEESKSSSSGGSSSDSSSGEDETESESGSEEEEDDDEVVVSKKRRTK